MIVAHNPVDGDADPSTSDVLAQVDLVCAALGELGVPAQPAALSGGRVWEELPVVAAEAGSLIFNLVEAPPGLPSVHPDTAAVFELLGLPFTGSSAATLWLTTDKLATRALLAAQGLPVAPGGRLDPERPALLERVPGPWILKPSCEDASLGLEGDPLCTSREAALARAAELARRFPGQALLAERYLPGREFNVSILAGEGGGNAGAGALPVAEIVFVDFPAEMARIVGYEAKWRPDSFAYTHTVRRFPNDRASQPLLRQLRLLALAAWDACGLSGYGRVDLRLDERGRPHILEVNANPCLAADAGFIAAAERAGLRPRDVVGRIVASALAEHGRAALPHPTAAVANATAAG
ncbi:MAG TPA: D-alanine--D-alanine ligase [Thermoanaerobaculia bacterium]|nr:D-alanine--D-alanine ligase [Thermoanaerobaculia bacterium]